MLNHGDENIKICSTRGEAVYVSKDDIAICPTNREKPTTSLFYSAMKNFAEGLARNGSPRQVFECIDKIQRRIFNYGQKLGLVNHSDECPFIFTRQTELDFSEGKVHTKLSNPPESVNQSLYNEK